MFYFLQVAHLDRIKRIWYLWPMQAAKVQVSLRIRAVSPEPPLLAHTGSESWGTVRQKARSLASLNGWACVVKICHDGMLEDTNLFDGAHLTFVYVFEWQLWLPLFSTILFITIFVIWPCTKQWWFKSLLIFDIESLNNDNTHVL